MSPTAHSIQQRRARRLVSHIVWLERHMPEATALNHRVRELELLLGTDSFVAELLNQSNSNAKKKRASRSPLFPYHNIFSDIRMTLLRRGLSSLFQLHWCL